MGANMSGKQCV